jgi:predicted RND superfamily exporter protein
MRSRSVLNLHRSLLKAVLAVVLHPRLTLLISGIIVFGCVGLALAYLKIDTDQDKLFSPHVGFFKDYLEYINRFQENEALYVLIEPADPKNPPPVARWAQAADRTAARLRDLDKSIVASVEDRILPSQLGNQALLFEDPHELEQSFQSAKTELAPLAQVWAQAGGVPMQRFLLGLSFAGPDKQKAEFASLLANSWMQTIQSGKANVPDLATLSATDPGDLGYTYVRDETNPDNHLLLIAVYLADDDNSLSAGEHQIDAIRQVAREENADFPEFHIAVTGRPALAADEMQTSDTDSTHAEILALVVIFVGLVFFLRSVWMAAAAEISLTIAIGWTFGWATVSVGELNILSLVFLITLIAIGMDYLVQILTRYRQEASRYERPTAIWFRVFRHVSAPIFTACLGAAGAFFVADLTDFRGAAELGVIAGGGLLLCLASGYTVLPALLVLFPPKMRRIGPSERYATPPPRRSVPRRLLPPALWVVVLLIVLPFSRRIYFNPNLLDLQAQGLESVKLVHKLQTWSAVVTTPDVAMLRKVRDAAMTSPYVAGTEGIIQIQDNYTWLMAHQDELPKITWSEPVPLTAADLHLISSAAQLLANTLQASQFNAAAADLRKFAAAIVAPRQATEIAAALSQWQSQFVRELHNLLAPFSPSPPDLAVLPAELRNHLVSPDGYYALYIYPKKNLWKREDLRDFELDLENRVDAIAGHPPVTGLASDIYHSTHSIETSFYKATAYALALVLILVFLDLRSLSQTLITMSVLGLGLPMLIGLMGLLRINWNFANFFGLPILIGAGHEYGVFMMHRYREVRHDPRRVWASWDVSDRALLLCAFVTTSSFAFFWWLGHHEGLRSLGLVMALGIACIYLAALLVVRPVLKWRIERAGHSQGKSPTRND